MAHPDLVGLTFGRLTVVSRITVNGRGKWLCKCECGGDTKVDSYGLNSGRCRSCGCLQAELLSQRSAKHRKTGSVEYETWERLRNRCNNKKGKQYEDYGGRGIIVCERWESFENFLIDMGERPNGTSLDRIDNNGNYEPGNCRWADDITQASNRRTVNWITSDGVTDTIPGWSRRLGINKRTLYTRYRAGIREPGLLLAEIRRRE